MSDTNKTLKVSEKKLKNKQSESYTQDSKLSERLVSLKPIDLDNSDGFKETDEKYADLQTVEPDKSEDDPALRPKTLLEFVGQPKVRELLAVCIVGAQNRQELLDHTLFYGPPGLGKTTLGHIISTEMGGGFKMIAAPSITRAGDLVALLVGLQPGDILFIDEIHRLYAPIAEVLYSAMEDFKVSILTGDPMNPYVNSNALTIDLPKFTLVGATTRSGMLPRPLRERFGITLKLDLYSVEDLSAIVNRSAQLLKINIQPDVCKSIAVRARGTPRIANRLLKRVRDFIPSKSYSLTVEIANQAFSALEIDEYGLDSLDHRYLQALFVRFKNKPVGLETLSAALLEDSRTLEDEVEPWLLMSGFIERTSRGRILGYAGEQLFNINDKQC